MNCTFGEALEALKQGKKVTRLGWNGKSMYLWLKPAITIKSEWCKDPILKEIVDANGGETEALGTICMKTADNKHDTTRTPHTIHNGIPVPQILAMTLVK